MLRPAAAPLLALLIAPPVLAAAQEPWPTTDFEVASTERLLELGILQDLPGAGDALIMALNEGLGGLDEWLAEAGMDPLQARIYLPTETTRRQIEEYLGQAATVLQGWGFSAPALREAGGRYQVILAAGTPAELLGGEAAGTYHPGVCGVMGGFLFLKARWLVDGEELTADGLETLGHELFHAVQAGTALGRVCPSPAGAWITEGSADAVGSDLLRILRGRQPSDPDEAWGLRDYSRRLPVPRVHPLQGGTDISAYHTSSLWRYLAERHALGGSGMPGPEDPGDAVDYGYLARLFNMDTGTRDCVGPTAACASELRWLDLGLRSVFGTNLRHEFPRFMDALARYGEHRLELDAGDPLASQQSGDRVRDQVFGDCPNVYLTPEFPRRISRERVEVLEPVSARCWNVFVEGFPDGVRVGMTVDGPAAREMSDLSASVGGRPTWADTAIVDGDAETDRSSVTWSYTVRDTTTTPFLLSNVGADPGAAARMTNLPVTFTILESTGSLVGMSPGGPSAAQIDAPVTFRLDDFPIAEVMPYTAPYEGADFANPCVLRFRMRNRETRDEITLQLDHEGPIGPGNYPVAPRVDGASDLDAPEEWPNQFVIDFGIGPRSSLSDGRPQAFRAEGGTVEIESVVGGLVRGRLHALGWRRRAHSVGQEPWGLSNLTIQAEFSVVVRDRVRQARLGRDAPPGSDCLEPGGSPGTIDASGSTGGGQGIPDPQEPSGEEGEEEAEETGAREEEPVEGEDPAPVAISLDFAEDPGSTPQVSGQDWPVARGREGATTTWSAGDYPLGVLIPAPISGPCVVPTPIPAEVEELLHQGRRVWGELRMTVVAGSLGLSFDSPSLRVVVRAAGPEAVTEQEVVRHETVGRTRYSIQGAHLEVHWNGGSLTCPDLPDFSFQVTEQYPLEAPPGPR